jgi:hypothetical protein
MKSGRPWRPTSTVAVSLYDLFNKTQSSSGYITSDDRMGTERIWKEVVVTKFESAFAWMGWGKRRENLSKYGRSAGGDLNPGLSKHKARLSFTRPQRSTYRSYSWEQLSYEYAVSFGGVI